MNDKQDNKLTMYRAVIALLTTTKELASAPAALKKKIADIETAVAKIPPLAATQALTTAGQVVEKNKALTDMAGAALAIAGAVQSYAAENSLDVLLEKVRVTESDLTSGRQQARVTLAQQIHDAAATVVANLGEYDVAPATLEDLETKIVTATAALSGPRTAAAARKASTAELPKAFKAVDNLLESQLDPLMLPYKRSNPKLYKKYEAARMIIDRAGTRTTQAPPAEPPATPGEQAAGGA